MYVCVFGERLTRVGLRNHVLVRVHVGATWQLHLNDSCSASVWAVTAITVSNLLFVNIIMVHFVCTLVLYLVAFSTFDTVGWASGRASGP